MALNPGATLLNGQYRILRQLGRGGFGFVYLAHDSILREKVAMKELIPALVGDEVVLKRFLAEAKATMRLRHKRIVGTHNVFAEGGNYYIVMEYMPGGSLEERLQEHGPLAVDEAVRVAAEVCEGLACAHEEGVVHCDLKPGNILFAADGSARVADFGIAHISEEVLTRTWRTPQGFVAGTLPYMSPEQAEGVRDDPRVDFYALGAVLYRTLTGQTYLEFDQRETPGATADNVHRIRHETPASPSTHNRRVPQWLDGVVLKALAKQPEARYNSASELRAVLLQRRTSQEAAAPPPAGTQPAPPRSVPAPSAIPVKPPPARRTPLPAWFWPAAASAAVLLVALVIAIGAALRGGDSTKTAVSQPTRTAIAVVTTAPVLPPTHTPTPTATPTGTDTPRPMVTATVAPRPTDTPLLPTATDTPQPTATLVPTATIPRPTATLVPAATPAPKAPQAGATQTRSKDGMTMVYVPAGDFTMGSSDADYYHGPAGGDERPPHSVYLDGFWVDKTEVTNAQFRKCVEAGVCQAPTTCDAGNPTYADGSKANHPVVCVDWNQAKAYCEWAGARLPTEAEWEKAARGTDGRLYPWGNGTPDCNKANSRGCAGGTDQVGSYPAGASPYGALDMAGNVLEWVNDWWGGYDVLPYSNPPGPATGSHKVVRGSSWVDWWSDSRAANRDRDAPDLRVHNRGFRCAADLPGG